MSHNYFNQKLRNQNGNSLVEFALTCPLFLAFFFAALQFGGAMYEKDAMYQAAVKAARAAVIAEDSSEAGMKTAIEASLKNSLSPYGFGKKKADTNVCYYLLNKPGEPSVTVAVSAPTQTIITGEMKFPGITVPEIKKTSSYASAFRNHNGLPSETLPPSSKPSIPEPPNGWTCLS